MDASNIALDYVLYNQVQTILSQGAVLLPTISDYSSLVVEGANSVDIPRLSKGVARTMLFDGNENADSGLGIAVDTLNFATFKEVPEFIYDDQRAKTAADLDAYFMAASPAVMADTIEQAIYAELKKAIASTPDHILTISSNPTWDEIVAAQVALDNLSVPMEERTLACNPAMKAKLLKIQEIKDASLRMNQEVVIKGQFAEVLGFRLVVSTNCDADEILCYHKTAMAFALKKSVPFVKERHESKNRDYVSLKANYGQKILDSGKRVVLLNSTGA